MARGLALAAALAVSLLAVAGAGGSEAQAPRVGGTVVYGGPFGEPACLSPLRDECAPGSTALTLGFIASKVLEGPFDVGRISRGGRDSSRASRSRPGRRSR